MKLPKLKKTVRSLQKRKWKLLTFTRCKKKQPTTSQRLTHFVPSVLSKKENGKSIARSSW
jgi:DUF1365 family protein